MTDAIAIHGHDIIDLVSIYPDGIRLSQLMELVGSALGNPENRKSGGVEESRGAIRGPIRSY